MKRREFVALLGYAAAVRPLPAGAQQGGPRAQEPARRIGLLTGTHSASIDAWLAGLRDHGWYEGESLIIDYRATGPRTQAPIYSAFPSQARPETNQNDLNAGSSSAPSR
jgi:hypothetical protein